MVNKLSSWWAVVKFPCWIQWFDQYLLQSPAWCPQNQWKFFPWREEILHILDKQRVSLIVSNLHHNFASIPLGELKSCRIKGRRVTMPEPRGRKSLKVASDNECCCMYVIKDSYLPTKFSSTELFPALWPPTTAIWGRSRHIWTPKDVNASWSLLTSGMSCSIPWLPDILQSFYDGDQWPVVERKRCGTVRWVRRNKKKTRLDGRCPDTDFSGKECTADKNGAPLHPGRKGEQPNSNLKNIYITSTQSPVKVGGGGVGERKPGK